MKKLLSLVLATIMCFSMMTAAFAAEMSFTDVKTSDWFYNDVKTAVEMGLVNGKTSTTYAPNDKLTYAEAIKLAACMNMLYLEGSVSFESGTPWYKPYVDYCINNGIIDKEYNYTDNATRAGYMGIFAKALPEEGLAEINIVPDNSIPDVPSSRAYAAGIYKLYRAGILTGVDAEHNCNPLANITRAEVAAILTRMMNEGKRVSITDMGKAEATEPEVKEPEVKEPETTEPEAKDPEVKEPETTEPSTGGIKDKFEQVNKEELKNEDFSMTIDKVVVVTGKGIVLTGYISAGKVNVGDTVYVNDADNVCIAKTTVKEIEMFNKSLDEVKRGDNAGILVDLDVDTYRSKIVAGNILSASEGSSAANKELAIVSQSKDMKGSVGIFNLNVEVEGGAAPYTYQWQRLVAITATGKKTQRYMNLVDSDGTIKGAQTAKLIISITELETYKYKCVITDAEGKQVTTEVITITVDSESSSGRVAIPVGGKSGSIE